MSHFSLARPGYSTARIFLHWLTAAIVLWGLTTGFGVAFLSRENFIRSIIDTINPQAATLLIPFFLWRAGLYLTSRPWQGWQGATWRERLALAVHAMLYGLIATVLATGVLMMPKPWKLLGLLPMPILFPGPAIRPNLFALHESLCLALLALIALHLAAIAWHVRRGHPILDRMTVRG